ncbi:virion structural protein [Roseobacter phage RD-1410W1-01]|uniref:Uncharacterized protein n=1 Tax=Roseobacter phage RD-1410W1-01 TaxID=1815984 RepID=A0A191VYK7_9CAUD|nr:virion structural protein [Roseobacter phage RD-1410W1-01]ANJ20802.1 hypothetical protein RDp01_gp68 [Roseobacter phage RD-1410W1-01]
MAVENLDNSSELANSLFATLTSGIDIPEAPDFSEDKYSFDPDSSSVLYQDTTPVSIDDVTTVSLEGDGAFDKMMAALDLHMEREFKAGRLTTAQYAEVYTAVTQSVLSNATSFALQKDQSKWAAIQAQMQARIVEIQATMALIELEKAKIETAKAGFDMNLTAANFAMTKMQTAVVEAEHDGVTINNALAEYNLNYTAPAEVAIKHYERNAVMPSTVAMNEFQVDRILPAQAAAAEYTNHEILPLEKALKEIQNEIAGVESETATYNLEKILPNQYAQAQHVLNVRQPAESEAIFEQIEQARAQTLDTRRDGLTPVSGVIGLQKEGLDWDNQTKDYVLANQLPRQVELVGKQIDLTTEQRESERAKTLDTRTDGATVEGSVGKQKDLYDQQIDSFVKDSQHKTAKMYLDSWITQKTLDEGLTAPTQLTNNEINEVLAAVRSNNSLGS